MCSKRNETNFETYSVVWVDALINCQENLDGQEKLRSAIHHLETFDRIDQCQKYLQSTSPDNRIILILSGQFGQQLISEIDQLKQIYSIYIYCSNKEFHQEWTKQYKKIKGVDNQIDDLIVRINLDHSRRRSHRDDEPLSILISDSKTNPEESTTGIDGRFVQFQLLISCLLKLKTTSKDKNEFISKCREYYKTNPSQLNVVNNFEKDYQSERSLWWYTRDAFVYRLLNKALRVQNIDLLYLFRFFIRDLEKELEQNRYSLPIHLYRGQFMSKEEIDQLKNSQGKLISTTTFLSTSFNPEVAQIYLGSKDHDDKFEKVLFQIYADPNLIGIKPFADISFMSCFPEESEVLMMLGSVFRLNNIYFDNNDQIWNIQMTLCSDNDCDLQSTVYHMKNQYGTKNRKSFLFAAVLIDMAHFDHAESYLRRLLTTLPTNHKDVFRCYQALGKVSCEKGNYHLSIHYLNKAIEILQNSQANNSKIAYIYNNLGEVYQNMNDTKQALIFYEKALDTFQKENPINEESIAWCYNNLGIIYERQKNDSQANDYLLKALTIKKEVLPDQHPCSANTFNNLGNVYFYQNKYKQALKQYLLAYQIFQKSLKPFHPSLARVTRNIALAYELIHDFHNANIYYHKAFDIRQEILSENHPDLIQIKNDIQRISNKII